MQFSAVILHTALFKYSESWHLVKYQDIGIIPRFERHSQCRILCQPSAHGVVFLRSIDVLKFWEWYHSLTKQPIFKAFPISAAPFTTIGLLSLLPNYYPLNIQSSVTWVCPSSGRLPSWQWCRRPRRWILRVQLRYLQKFPTGGTWVWGSISDIRNIGTWCRRRRSFRISCGSASRRFRAADATDAISKRR